MIIQWAKGYRERRAGLDDLMRLMRTHTPHEAWRIHHGISKLTPATRVALRKFIESHTAAFSDVARAVFTVLDKYSDAETRILIVMRNYDHAMELGWKYAPTSIPMILEGIDEAREWLTNLTPEQESALLVLEDSQWVKKYTINGGGMQRSYQYHPSVRTVVLERPQDIDRIIDAARHGNPQHAAHLTALLDGTIHTPLSEGAL